MRMHLMASLRFSPVADAWGPAVNGPGFDQIGYFRAVVGSHRTDAVPSVGVKEFQEGRDSISFIAYLCRSPAGLH